MSWNCRCGESVDDVLAECPRCQRVRRTQGQSTAVPVRSAGTATSESPTAFRRQLPFMLLPDERVIATFGNQVVFLTSCRVRSYFRATAGSSMTSIMLDQVASTSLETQSKPWLILTSVLAIVVTFAFWREDQRLFLSGIALAIALFIVYLFTIRKTIVITSAGDSIRITLTASSEAAARAFIDDIDVAKELRYRAVATT